MFSRTCEYAIKVMIYIFSREQHDGSRVGVREIADAIESPRAFTAKVLHQLAKAKLLSSAKGPNGGFAIAKKDVTLGEIVEAIDGDRIVNGCILGFDECSSQKPCAVHGKFVKVREELQQTLAQTSLDEVSAKVVNNKIRLRK